MSRRVEVCRALLLDGEEVDCVVTVTVAPGGGDDRTEPRYGGTVDEVVSVRTDDKDSRPVPPEFWPQGLADEVRDAAVEAAADQEQDDYDDAQDLFDDRPDR